MALLNGIKMTNLGPKVDIGAVFGRDVTYAELGAAFHVNAHDILIEVQRGKGTNEQALIDLYAAHFPLFFSHRFEGEPRAKASQYWHYAHGGVDGIPEYRLPFLSWKIPASVVIRMPRSVSDPKLLLRDQKNLSRVLRVGVEHPDFSRLELISDRLFDLAAELQEKADVIHGKVVPAARASLAYLLSAERLLSIVEGSIRNTPNAWVTRDGPAHADLHDALSTAIDRTTGLLLTKPFFFEARLQREVQDLVGEIEEVLSDPSAVAVLQRLVPFYDIAQERDVWERFENALLLASRAIMRSGQTETFIEDYFIPFLGALAESTDVQPLLERVKDASLRKAITSDWRQLIPKQKPDSLFQTLGSVGSVGASSVGNSRGPASLAVSLVMVVGPAACNFLAKRSLALSQSGTLGSGLSLRLVIRLADLSSAADFDTLWNAVDERNLQRLRDIDWSTKAMSGSLWAGAYALANLAVFLSVLTSDEEMSLEHFATIVQSGTQLAVPMAELGAVLAKHAGKSDHFVEKILSRATGLAWTASILAVGLAAWTCVETSMKWYAEGTLGFEDMLSYAGSVGTFASVGAWMYIATVGHAASSWWTATMAFGSILALSALVVALAYRQITAVSGAGAYVRACVDTFVESDEGKKMLAADEDLRDAFGQFEKVWEAVDSKIVSLGNQSEHLGDFARWFSADGCAMILEMNPALVRKILG